MPVTFDRSRLPEIRGNTSTALPVGAASYGGTGLGQYSQSLAVGRIWTEFYRSLPSTDPRIQSAVAYVSYLAAKREQIEIDLPDRGNPNLGIGPAAGPVLVNGAGQTGETLVTDGWGANRTNVLRAGDVIRVAGILYALDVIDDASSDAGGGASLKVWPPILEGGSPADGAVVTVDSITVRARIFGVPELPECDVNAMYSGFRVTFRESPE